MFVHVSAVERAGLQTLREGQSIEHEIESNSCIECWKLLNIEVIGFRSVQSEKVGEHPSTPQALPPHYRTAPPILKKVAKTKSLRRRKRLSIGT